MNYGMPIESRGDQNGIRGAAACIKARTVLLVTSLLREHTGTLYKTDAVTSDIACITYFSMSWYLSFGAKPKKSLLYNDL